MSAARNIALHLGIPALCCVVLSTTVLAGAEERPPLIGRPASITVVKPGQLSLSPDGDRVAITERFGNAIQVLDSRGNIVWSVDQTAGLDQPVAVAFANSNDLIFSQWDAHNLFRVSQKSPSQIDTVADLTTVTGAASRISKLYAQPDKSWLILTSNPDQLVRVNSDFSSPKIVLKYGSSKGRIDRPSSVAFTLSGRLAVASRGANPVQVFDQSGKLIVAADWNASTPVGIWEAAAIAVDQQERIWVFDATNVQLRQYDQTGTLLSVRNVTSGNRFPTDMVITADNQLVIVDAGGRIDIYDLAQEN